MALGKKREKRIKAIIARFVAFRGVGISKSLLFARHNGGEMNNYNFSLPVIVIQKKFFQKVDVHILGPPVLSIDDCIFLDTCMSWGI